MKTSVRWLNQLLEGQALSGEAIERSLMAVGLPSESREAVQTRAGPDECLDVEVTSNRGDCLSHVGLARELAACADLKVRLRESTASGAHATRIDDYPRTLVASDYEAGPDVASVLSLENHVPDHCPLFLARVIKGVKVAESPAWLRASLEAIGQRPINNIVDVTNFIAGELGNPCHAFDLAKLAHADGKPALRIRLAHPNERLTTLDAKPRVLKGDEVVVADSTRAQGLAGIMGGGESEVSGATTDVVLEVATWDPVAVRKAARRHQIRTIASHRYERIVDARTLDAAMDRAAALIALLGGGKVLPGTLRAGKPLANPMTVRFRTQRCLALLGFELPRDRMLRHLTSVGIEVGPLGRGGDDLLCTIPVWRPDLTREIDLIEEVARIEGLDAVPVHDKMAVRVRPPQPSERARRELGSVLTGLGFHETITFSFTTPKHAKAFTPSDLEPIVMDDARRGDEPALRPSVLTGLLTCRTRNQHSGVQHPPAASALAPLASVGAGGVRLFELASAFAQKPASKRSGTPGHAPTAEDTIEHFNAGLLLDCPGRSIDDQRAGVRAMRGVVEALVKSLSGDVSRLVVEAASPHAPAFAANGYARLSLFANGSAQPLGYFSLLDKSALASFDLAVPVVVAELNLAVLLAHYPPKSRVVLPPTLPAIERDLSLIVRDDLPYATIAAALDQRKPANLERIQFVTTYRGKPLQQDQKSVTVRLAFRDAGRTLTKEELEAPVATLLASLKGAFAFEIRA